MSTPSAAQAEAGLVHLPIGPVETYLEHINTIAPLTLELDAARQEDGVDSIRLRLAEIAMNRLDKEIDDLGQREEVVRFVVGSLQSALAVDRSVHHFGHLMPPETRDEAHDGALHTVQFARAFSERHGIDLSEGTDADWHVRLEDGYNSGTCLDIIEAHRGLAPIEIGGTVEAEAETLPSKAREWPELSPRLPEDIVDALRELVTTYTVSRNGDISLPSLLPRTTAVLKEFMPWLPREMERAVGAQVFTDVKEKLKPEDVIRLAARRVQRHFCEDDKNEPVMNDTIKLIAEHIKIRRSLGNEQAS